MGVSVFSVSVMSAVRADDLAGHSAPPELPGLIAASVWIAPPIVVGVLSAQARLFPWP
ncbi:hypothetical protein [Microtetraspora sp. NBRC 13810]|uniref:hypothetical protein n=1 Tax=Microtetraspora sp. NBRC 13810 TaxID=3030990 RepID=UPI002554BE28|nr:hypothetical protein [Microtetraspora sp. NBRC 13810]